ncbi:DNRLRE domain-containing protein [Lewinella sp. LCG006]|uniref:DNRLRE domain-containing protein n=1 Tax=Lewinella sp. LCG006 TaxID=3231911 RepID=UPI003460FF94
MKKVSTYNFQFDKSCRNFPVVLLSCLIFLLSTTTGLAQTTVTITSTKATSNYQNDPTFVWGNDDVIFVERENNFLGRSFIEFDISSIPTGAVITSATLSLVKSSINDCAGFDGAGSNFTSNILRVTRAWSEGTTCDQPQAGGLSWNSAGPTNWSTPGGDFAPTTYGSFTGGNGDADGSVKTINVTALVNEWHTGTQPNYGLGIVPQGTGADFYNFYSDDFSTVSRRPSLTISYINPIVLSTSVTNVDCSSDTDGAINLSVSGGTAPFTYNWSNGATTQDISGLPPGTYSVTVSDANSQTQTASATVQNIGLDLSATVFPESTAGAMDGTINLSVSGGSTPYAYAWSNGATTQNISGLAAGTYTVTVSDNASASCTLSKTVLVAGTEANKQLYLSDGQTLDRIDPVITNDNTTASTSILQFGAGVVTIENTTSVQTDDVTSVTLAHTINNSTDRFLLVSLSFRENAGNVAIGSVTYGGASMTLVGATANGADEIALYSLKEANLPVGTANVVVTFLQNDVDDGVIVGATSFSGVNQTTSLGTFASAIGNSNTASVSVPSAAGDLVFDVFDLHNVDNRTRTPGANQTARYNIQSSAHSAGGASTELATGASTTMSWSFSGSETWAIGGVAIKPATANPITSFTQAPALCDNLTIVAGSPLTVRTFVNITGGTMPASPNITATIRYGGTNIAILTSPTYNAGSGTLTWSTTLGGDLTIPAGQAIILEVNTAQSGVAFTIDYDSATKPSLIELPVSTFININSLELYDAPYPGGIPVASALPGSTVYVRAVVSDPFGSYDITGMNLALVDPLGGTSAAVATSVDNTSCTRTYEYAWTISNADGTSQVQAIAREGFENTVVDDASQTITSCSGASLSFTTSKTDESGGGTNDGTITISNPSGSTGPWETSIDGINWFPVTASTPYTFNGLTGDTYFVRLRDANDSDVCTSTQTVIIDTPLANKQLYLSDGQTLDRIDPVTTNDATTASTTGLIVSGNQTVQVESVSSTSEDDGNSTTTLSHTVTASSSRLLLVGVSLRRDKAEAMVTGVTYGGSPMTQVGQTINGNEGTVAIYRMINPPVGTFDVIANYNNNANRGVVLGAISFSGVDQTTPLGTYVGNTGDSGTASVTASSASGQLVFDVVCWKNPGTLVSGAGQTQRWNVDSPSEIEGGASTEPGAGSVTMSWTAGSDRWAIGAVPIRPASITPNLTETFTQSPTLCSPLTILGGETITVEAYTTVTSGAMPASPNISATLRYGGTNITTLTNPTYNAGTGLLTWTGTLGSDLTVPAGQSITLDITTAQSGVAFTIDYDSQTDPSLIDLPVSTFININSLDIYDAPFPGGSLITQAAPGSTVYVRSVVSDPFGFNDITGQDILITEPGGGTSTVAATSVATSGCTRTYEYTYAVPAIGGDYNFLAIAREGTEGVVVDTETTTLNTCPPSITATVTPMDVSCNGASDGTITVSAPSGGTSPYEVSINGTNWFTVTSGSPYTFTGLALNSYTIDIREAGAPACMFTLGTFNITQPPVLIGSVGNQTNVLCFGENTGSVMITATGGTAPYQYALNAGTFGSSASFTGLVAGAQTVTVRDANGCEEVVNFTITQPAAALAVTPTIVQPTCFDFGGITLSVSGGTAPYTYNWSDLVGTSNPQDRSGLTAGNYSVVVTDANGCTVSSGVLTLNPPNNCAPITVCLNDPITTFSVDPNPLNTSYTWTVPVGAVIVSGQGTPEIVVDWGALSIGSYQVCVEAANECGTTPQICQDVDVADINATASTNPACVGEDLQLFASGGNSYLWSGPNGFSSSSANPVIPNANLSLDGGTYSVTVTNGAGCTAVASVTVEVNPLPVINPFVVTPSFCGSATGAVDLTVVQGTTPYTYAWSNGATTQDIVNIPAGNYTVTVTDANGCTANASTFIVINSDGPTITTTKVDVVCFGDATGSIDLTASGTTPPYIYQWSNGAMTEDLSGLTAGEYGVTVTDVNGCFSVTSVEITQPTELLTDHTQVNVSCFGESTGSIDLIVTGGTMPYSYSWTLDGGPFGAITQDLSGLAAGTYAVTVTDGNLCTVTRTIIITEPASAVAASSVVTDVSCFGDSDGQIVLMVMGGTAPYSYSWMGPGGFTAATKNISGLSAGTYDVTITDALGCTFPLNIVVSEPDPLMIVSLFGISACDVTCNGANDGAIYGQDAQGGTAPFTFQWSTGATGVNLLNGLAPGTYMLTVTDANGCTATSSYTISEPPALVVTPTVMDVDCFGDATGSVTLVVNGGPYNNYNFTWSNGATTQNLNGIPAGTYSVTVSDVLPGFPDECPEPDCSVIVAVTINQPPVINLGGAVTNILCNGENTGAIDLTVSGGAGGFSFAWSDGPSTMEDRTGLMAGTYTVTVTDANSCTKSQTFTITEPLTLLLSMVNTNLSCFGDTDGSIDLSVSGGVTPYSYSWSNSAMTQDLTGLSAGMYTVTVTDGNGCMLMMTSNPITQPDELTVGLSLNQDVTCKGGMNGSATVTPNGGTGAYTYQWSNGSMVQTPTDLAAGDYTVTVTDTNGCIAIGGPITIAEPTTMIMLFATTLPASSCGGSTGSIDLTVENGTAPFSYSWSGPTAIGDIQDPTGLAAGTYMVVVTDVLGCNATLSVDVLVADALMVMVDVVDPTCAGADGETFAIVSGGVGPYTYLWSTGAITEALIDLPQGTYSVTVTDVNGCTANGSGTLTNPTDCAPPVAVDDVFCTLPGMTVNGSAAPNDSDPDNTLAELTFINLNLPDNSEGDLVWSNAFNGDFTFIPTPGFLGTVIIPYQVCDPTGFCDEANIIITIQLEAGMNGTTAFCAGETTPQNLFDIITGEDPNGVWTETSTTSSGVTINDGTAIDFSGVAAGVYEFTYTHAANGTCLEDQSTATITVNSSPNNTNPVVSDPEICLGETDVITVTNTQVGVTYQLRLDSDDTPVGAPVAGNGGTISFTVSPTMTTVYNVLATNTSTGCSNELTDMSTVTVNVLPNPDPGLTVDDDIICVGETATISIANSENGVQYQLRLEIDDSPVGAPVVGNGTAISFPVSPTVTTTYNILATIIDTGCDSELTDKPTVTVEPLPIVYNVTGGGTYCSDDVSPQAIGLSDSEADVSYTLFRNGATVVEVVPGTGVALSFTPQSLAGTYTVVGTRNTGEMCSSNMSGSAIITIETAPTAFLVTGGGTYCTDDVMAQAINLSDSEVNVNYALIFNGSTTIEILAGTGVALNFTPQTAAGTYTVVGTSTLGQLCDRNMTGNAIITTEAPPTVYAVTGGGAYCDDNVIAQGIGLSDSEAGVNYALILDGSTTVETVAGTGSALAFTAQTTAGTYTVVATSTTGELCDSDMSGSAMITIEAAPTAFLVTGGGAYCDDNVIAQEIGLSDSETGVNYALILDGTTTVEIIAGTGSALAFTAQTIVGTYTVVATSTTGELCDSDMAGSAIVDSSPSFTAGMNGSTTLCAGEMMLQNLYDIVTGEDGGGTWSETTSSGVTIGDGTMVDFSGVAPGTYTFVYTLAASGSCPEDMSTATVEVFSNPTWTSTTTVDPQCGLDNGQLTFFFTDDPARTTIEFSIDGGLTYPYSFADNAGSGSTLANLAPGTYDLYARWDNGECPVDIPDVTLIEQFDSPIISVGSVACVDGSTYEYTFAASPGATVVSANGTVSGNTVTVAVGMNDVLTATNVGNCAVSLNITSPVTCNIMCEQPDLTLGNGVCNGATYSISFTETTGATINASAGTISGNVISGIPVGTNVVVTATNAADGNCVSVLTATSPDDCGEPCPDELLSVSALGICAADGLTYSVNFTLSPGATLTTDPAVGTIGTNMITGIPAGVSIRLIATDAACNLEDDIVVPAPDCCADAPIASVGSVMCVDGSTYEYTFAASPGATAVSTNGTISGNTVTVAVGTNDVLTVYNDINCESVVLNIMSPVTCNIMCEQPDLTLGNGICNGATYSISFTETTGATISASAGTIIGNVISGIPVGTNVVVTATNAADGDCVSVLTATSPDDCGEPCPDELLSVSALGICAADGLTYSVNFTLSPGATLTTDPAVGTIGTNMITGIPAGVSIRLIATDAACNLEDDIVVPAPDCCADAPIASVGSVMCVDGSTYEYTFAASPGATAVSTNGTISGNTVTVAVGTNDVLTVYNDINCESVVLNITSPVTCNIMCEQPDLTLGNGICNGATYSISFTETTGATISASAGTISGNVISGIPVGTNVVVTATNAADGNCVSVLTATSPDDCGEPCPDELLSVSALGICAADGLTYSVNFTLSPGATLTTDPAVGTIGTNMITGIPAGVSIRLIATDAACNLEDDIVVPAPDCCADAPIASVGSVTCVDGSTYEYTFAASPGATAVSTNGTISGNTVTVVVGTNDVLTVYNDVNCESVVLNITSPVTCNIMCEQPDLTLGNGVCNGATYSISFTETTGATISASAGTISGNVISGIPVGTNVVVTATNAADGNCVSVLTATSPDDCGEPCPDELLSVSALGICAADGLTYSVNFTLSPGAILTTDPAVGTIGTNMITGIPAGVSIRLIATDAACNLEDDIVVPAPDCCPDAPVLSIGSVMCVDGSTYQYTFAVSPGATVVSTNGTVSGNIVTVAVGTNDVLTAYNAENCPDVVLSVTSPVTCNIMCEQPDLTVGNSVCDGSMTYSVSFTETTGATITTAPGSYTITGNVISGIPVGTDVMITATNPSDGDCAITLTALSPDDCPSCPEELISVSALGVCAPDGQTYSVNFVLAPGATLTTSPAVGTIGMNVITGIPVGVNIRLIATNDACNKVDDIVVVAAPDCLPPFVKLNLRVRLQGALLGNETGLMRDDLRIRGFLPVTEPYTALGSFTHVVGGGETVTDPMTVFADYGNNSIVDWVFVELRSAVDPATVLETRSGLVQRDGDVVDVDGVSPLCFTQSVEGEYYVAVRHRNHLGAMTAVAIPMIATGTLVDFTDTNLNLWNNQPIFNNREQKVINGEYALWAGNTLSDDRVVFAGQSNDKDPIFNRIDSAPGNFFKIQTYILPGYNLTDVNLDGDTIFAGQRNDVDPIFNNVDGHPANFFKIQTFIIFEQLAQ